MRPHSVIDEFQSSMSTPMRRFRIPKESWNVRGSLSPSVKCSDIQVYSARKNMLLFPIGKSWLNERLKRSSGL